MTDMIEYAKIAERCQRGFDTSQLLPNKHVKEIINVCTTMPTKQNLPVYSLFALEDRDVIEGIYEYHTMSTLHAETEPDYRNGQTNAPLLLIWCEDATSRQICDQVDDIDIAIGISSGAAALTAASLGYRTGFCKCFDQDKVSRIFAKTYGKKKLKPRLMLGVGLPHPKHDRFTCLLNDQPVNKRPTAGDKTIRVIRSKDSRR